MKRHLTFPLCSLALAFSIASAQAGEAEAGVVFVMPAAKQVAKVAIIQASRSETLQSINWVENPTNSSRPGSHGELGAYQFMAETWRMHTDLPFAQAVDRHQSDEVAALHYEWVKNTLVREGVEPTTYNIALAWNAGVNAVINGRAPARSHDYAMRVTNLANDLSARQSVAMR